MKKLLFLFFWPIAVGAEFYQDFSEIPIWARTAAQRLREKKIMLGDGDGRFSPHRILNRAEFVVLLSRMKNAETEKIFESRKFSDVGIEDWFAPAVIWATEKKWVLGTSEKKFSPEKKINRAELATFISRAFELENKKWKNIKFSDISAESWYGPAAFLLAENDLLREIVEDKTGEIFKKFNPEKKISRAEMAWTIDQILKIEQLKKTQNSQRNRWNFLRRPAVRPKDFNSADQGYEIEKKSLGFSTNFSDEKIEINSQSDWKNVGEIKIKNSLDGEAKLNSIELRLRFSAENVGPRENFFCQISGENFFAEKEIFRDGRIFLGGLALEIPAGDEKNFAIKIKPNLEKNFYANSGDGRISIVTADGTFVSQLSDGTRKIRFAPIEYFSRDLQFFNFSP